jgi:hypothetical protein
MTDGLTPKPPGRVRGRPFEKGRSGSPLGRRVGCRDKTTIAAAAVLAGEAETLTPWPWNWPLSAIRRRRGSRRRGDYAGRRRRSPRSWRCLIST